MTSYTLSDNSHAIITDLIAKEIDFTKKRLDLLADLDDDLKLVRYYLDLKDLLWYMHKRYSGEI